MKKVYIIQTSLVSHQELNALFADLVPEARIHNLVDDSMLQDVMLSGGLTANVTSRMCAYVQAAANNGADLIFNQCSSVGEAADIAARLVSVPVLKIDAPMAEKAVELGTKIGVVATVQSTMRPSCNLIRSRLDVHCNSCKICDHLLKRLHQSILSRSLLNRNHKIPSYSEHNFLIKFIGI